VSYKVANPAPKFWRSQDLKDFKRLHTSIPETPSSNDTTPRTAYSRDDHHPVFRLDIRQDSEFATGYGYPKTAFKREPDTDPDIRNGFIDISRIQTFGKSYTLHNHSRYDYGTIIHSLSSEASFQPSVPWLRVCLWCTLCTVVQSHWHAKFVCMNLFLLW